MSKKQNGTTDEQRRRYRRAQQPRVARPPDAVVPAEAAAPAARETPPSEHAQRPPDAPPTVPVDATGDERPLMRAATYEEPTLARPAAPPREPRRIADRVVARLVQVVDYLFYLLYGLLGIRFLLRLVGAREDAGFVRFIDRLTDPFYEPFTGIVARPAADGGLIDLPLLIALVAYFVLHLAVRGMLRLFMSRNHTTVIHRS